MICLLPLSESRLTRSPQVTSSAPRQLTDRGLMVQCCNQRTEMEHINALLMIKSQLTLNLASMALKSHDNTPASLFTSCTPPSWIARDSAPEVNLFFPLRSPRQWVNAVSVSSVDTWLFRVRISMSYRKGFPVRSANNYGHCCKLGVTSITPLVYHQRGNLFYLIVCQVGHVSLSPDSLD